EARSAEISGNIQESQRGIRLHDLCFLFIFEEEVAVSKKNVSHAIFRVKSASGAEERRWDVQCDSLLLPFEFPSIRHGHSRVRPAPRLPFPAPIAVSSGRSIRDVPLCADAGKTLSCTIPETSWRDRCYPPNGL